MRVEAIVLEANKLVHSGPNGRPLQIISNFPAQQQQPAQLRNTAANGRSTTNKIASGSTWGGPATSTLPSQARDTSATSAMESYARATDGQQSSTRQFFDSDFPTLANPSGQTQSSQFASNVWAKPTASEQSQRQQRPQRLPSEQTSSRPQRPADSEDMFSTITTSSRQQQSTGGHEPPRRSSIFQSDGYQSGVFGGRMLPPGMDNQREMLEPDARDPSRLTSPSALSQGLSSSRSPNPQGLNGTIGQDRMNGGAPGLPSMAQRTVRQSDYTRPSPQMSQGIPGLSPQDAFAGPADASASPIGEQQDQSLDQILDGMTPQDRWGLAGLVAAYQGPNDFRRSLTRGQDLAELGLNMDDPEPLLKKWRGPWGSADSAPPRPLNDDFSIPACYNVQNVNQLHRRIPSFSDETLFYIFYTMPRDITQEMVADELMGRKWRFHIPQRMWMTRDENAQPPIEVESGVSESGTYWWWNPISWSKQRKPFILRYTELDDRVQRGIPVGGGAGMGPDANGFNVVPNLEAMAAGLGRGF